MNLEINYRPDIDGLRAIAVLSVLFYHAGIEIFSGGFVGVDVFFVISGFLITTIIVRENEVGEFSFIRFYERRIRRIYPALYVLILLVMLGAFILYNPETFQQVGKSAMAATFFSSNILFWYEAGYFDAPSSLKPLLHTWSLAVEEQFYILFPWLVYALMRFASKWYKTALAVLALTSFLASVYFVQTEPTSAFYFFHLRAWELMIGGLLAVKLIPQVKNTVSRNALSLTGFIMILYGIFSYSQEIAFPGTAALLPTVGAALIIYSGVNGTTLIGKFLGLTPVVFIGKISYSLYLWHWPIFIFGKYYIIREPTNWDTLIWLIASFVIASISWKFVENPFRARMYLEKPKIFYFAGGVMALTMILAGAVYLGNGLPQRFNPEQFAQIFTADKQWDRWKKCNNSVITDLSELVICEIKSDNVSPSFLVWGDSHARSLAPVIEASAKENHLSGYLITRPACPPLLGVDRVGEQRCSDYSEITIQYIKAHPELTTIILSGRWTMSADGRRYKNEDGSNVILIDHQFPTPKGQNAVIFEAGLDRTVSKLIALRRNVVIISSIPDIGYDVTSAYFISIRTGRDINTVIAPTIDEYLERNRVVISVMNDIKLRYNVQIVEPATVLCDENICLVASQGRPLYRDSDHLSTFGSLFLSELFNSFFKELSASLQK